MVVAATVVAAATVVVVATTVFVVIVSIIKYVCKSSWICFEPTMEELNKHIISWTAIVAQLLPIPEVHGSNPVISNIFVLNISIYC